MQQEQKRPKDVIGCAVMVAKIATGEVEDKKENKMEENKILTEEEIQAKIEEHQRAKEEFKEDLVTLANLMKGKFGWDNEDYLDFLTDIMHYFDHHKKDFPHIKKDFGTIFAQKFFLKRIN